MARPPRRPCFVHPNTVGPITTPPIWLPSPPPPTSTQHPLSFSLPSYGSLSFPASPPALSFPRSSPIGGVSYTSRHVLCAAPRLRLPTPVAYGYGPGYRLQRWRPPASSVPGPGAINPHPSPLCCAVVFPAPNFTSGWGHSRRADAPGPLVRPSAPHPPSELEPFESPLNKPPPFVDPPTLLSSRHECSALSTPLGCSVSTLMPLVRRRTCSSNCSEPPPLRPDDILFRRTP